MNKERIEEFFGCGKKCDNYAPIANVIVPLYLSNRLLVENSERICRAYEISHSELDVLLTVNHSGKAISPTELYEGMLFSSGGMTKILKRLESQKFIKRVPCKSDKRSKLVEITAKGKELAQKVLMVIFEDEEDIFSCLDSNEKEVLEVALKKIVRKLMNR